VTPIDSAPIQARNIIYITRRP